MCFLDFSWSVVIVSEEEILFFWGWVLAQTLVFVVFGGMHDSELVQREEAGQMHFSNA